MLNKFIGIGRLTKDPELKYLPNNIPTTNFTIAVNRPFENAQGEKETDYINVVVWRKQAENVAKYVSKGSLVAVDGRIQTRNYEDKDGKKVYVTEIVADNVQFLQTKQEEGQAPKEKSNSEYVKDAFTQEQAFKDFGEQVELSEDDIAF